MQRRWRSGVERGLFFFSSRRRHTRLQGDWSSDVCSSDLSGSSGTTRVTWEAVDLLDAGMVRDAISRLRPPAVYHCAGAAHVGRSWDKTASTLDRKSVV